MSEDRPVVLPEFGAYLVRSRERRGLTSGQAQAMLNRRYGFALSKTVLWRYEQGMVESPDAAILWGLSRIYRISSDELFGCLAKERARHPIAQSDLETPGITDRSAGLSDEAMSLARTFESLRTPHRALISIQASMLKQLEAQDDAAVVNRVVVKRKEKTRKVNADR